MNLQFRNKTDFVGLFRNEKLIEKSYFFQYPTHIEQISISFDTDYQKYKTAKQRPKISKLR